MSEAKKHDPRRDVLRQLTGELDGERARQLERKLASDPDLAAWQHRLETAWRKIEAPPPSPLPAGFAARVVEAARRQRTAPAPAPFWRRAGSAAALGLGLALGVLLGAGGGERTADELWLVEQPPSLAESYLQSLEGDGEGVLP